MMTIVSATRGKSRGRARPSIGVLDGVLQEEMTGGLNLDVIRESIDPEYPTAVDDLGKCWSAARAEAGSYVRAVVYAA